MRRPHTFLAGVSAALFAAGVAAPAASAQTYKAIGEYKLTGSSAKGLAVDSAGRRIFVATSDGVSVINADTGAAVGTISGLKNVEDVLLVPGEVEDDKQAASTTGFATDASGHVVGFSLADLKASPEMKLDATGPSTLCYDTSAKTVEVVTAGGALATINPEAKKIVKQGKIHTGDGQIACGTLNHIYVADPAMNVVHVLNHETLKNDGDLPMTTGQKPSGLALDTRGRRLFVTCMDGTIEVIDTDAGFTFAELKSGSGAAHGTWAWTPQGKGQWKAAAFIAQADGTLSAVRMMAYINYTLGGSYKLNSGLGSVAYDDKTHHLFITSMNSGAPVVIVAGY